MAFHMIKTRIEGREPDYYAITFEHFEKLIKYNYPKKSDVKIKIIFKILDFKKDNCLSKYCFKCIGV